MRAERAEGGIQKHLSASDFDEGDLVSWTGECYRMGGRIVGRYGANEITSEFAKQARTGLVTAVVGDHLEVLHGGKFYVLQIMLHPEKVVVWKERVW